MLSEQSQVSGPSFQTKLFFIFTILTFCISCVFISWHSYDKANEINRHAAKEVHLLAQQLADAIRLPLYAENTELLVQSAEKVGRIPGISAVTITAPDGRVLARYRAPKAAPGEVIGDAVQVTSLPAEISLEHGLPGDRGGLLIGTVHVERETGDLRHSLYRDLLVSCLVTLLFWLAVSSLCFLVLRRLTRSYNALVKGVKTMQGGDFTSRIAVVSADEPGRVAQAVNGLAASLEQRQAENRRLHEELVASIETEVAARQELASVNRSLEQEILEHAHAEQAARKSEQTLKALMDVMPVGVISADQQGHVDYVNGFLVQCFGYLREEIPSLDAWFALAFPDPAYCRQMIEAQHEALAQRKSEPLEARVTCRNGMVRRVLLSNEVSGSRTIFIVVDITDRELMQEQAIKVQKLESLGVLAGGIAHNFNNALTGVLGFISLACNTLDKSHGAQEYLQYAVKASQRAAGMAKQLLTFASGGSPVKKPVSVKKLVEEVRALTHNVSNVRCECDLPESLPSIRGDEGQLIQAFSNIVINAMQAMPEGGTIAICARADLASCPDPSHGKKVQYVSLSFTDQGHGICEADLSKIFDPYFTTKGTSTGLGLASVHSIVYKHGGHVTVASRPGQGTCFTICLPSSGEAAPPAREAVRALEPAPAGSGTVLIMDDEELIREFTRKTLGFLGYDAVVCADGREAVQLYRERCQAGAPFRAAILDLTVPGGMGGVEVAREILALDPEAKLIVASGYSYDPVMARHKDYGFCAAIAKPYKADQLSYELRLLH